MQFNNSLSLDWDNPPIELSLGRIIQDTLKPTTIWNRGPVSFQIHGELYHLQGPLRSSLKVAIILHDYIFTIQSMRFYDDVVDIQI